MKTLKIYLRKGDIGDATAYYVETVAEAFRMQGYQVSQTTDVKSIQANDTVFVITMKSWLRVWIHSRHTNIIMWFQGIVPEEAMMQFANHWSRGLRYYVWSLAERFVLKKSLYLLFVSQQMVLHYEHKYGFKKVNYYIMPCFNLPLNESAFEYRAKYQHPTFVYAGTLSVWQCIDQTLALCRAIQDAIPESRFTILTNEIDKGIMLSRRYGLINIEVKYVPSTEVGAELIKHKYGFLLREDTEVNNVATPTKLNSYMASGVIPIYSDVIRDFSAHLVDTKYPIRVYDINQPTAVVKQIMNHELHAVIVPKIKEEFKAIFTTYYSRPYHISCLAKHINDLDQVQP